MLSEFMITTSTVFYIIQFSNDQCEQCHDNVIVMYICPRVGDIIIRRDDNNIIVVCVSGCTQAATTYSSGGMVRDTTPLPR